MSPAKSPNSAVGSESSPGQLSHELEAFSCLACRQRKVKCDRQTPCSNCIKAQKECSFVPPVRGKRKRTKPPREGLHAKLRRYEHLLESCGVRLEGSENDDDAVSTPETTYETHHNATKTTAGTGNNAEPYRLGGSKPVLISRGGDSRYMESSLWSDLSREFKRPDIDELNPSAEAIMDSYEEENDDILLGPYNTRESRYRGPDTSSKDIGSLCLSEHVLEKLCATFSNAIDPLTKVLHLPTFRVSLRQVQQNPRGASRSMQALVLSFYLATISVMEEDQCLGILGSSKEPLLSRYRHAARVALTNAGLLSTTSLVVLQAYVLFLVGARNIHRADTLFIYSGVAIRLARKMGLHRDGSALGLSPFESEIRRRLWWTLVINDYKLSDTLGVRPSMDLARSDVRMPLNVEEDDLHPDMANEPQERSGITAATLARLRCEIFSFLRNASTSSGDFRLEFIASADLSMAAKNKYINELEDLIEKKYIRYCDPSNPLHVMTSVMGRSAICKLRLHAYAPRRSADARINASQSEREMVSASASKLLELSMMVFNTESLRPYKWQVNKGHIWTMILFVLIEVCHQKTGPQVDRAWGLIWDALDHSRPIFDDSGGVLFQTLRKWIVEVWDRHTVALREAGSYEPPEPEQIRLMRRFLANSARPQSARESRPQAPVSQTDICHGRSQDGEDMNSMDADSFGALGSYDFSDLLSFETNMDEWMQWDNLVAEERGFA
ncbi:C6 transcription factor [Stachybotrys elegans]|uniref:C6 transcription factor n=1 Tax=Stachybotrys elegans TaxID=80388 RepID=A0A8K0SZ11_9HYPO|nr:C6 transcription factor [Stachybotrys elegans]